MDILSYLSNMIVPRWVKVSITVVLMGFLGLFVAIGYLGIIEGSDNGGWIEAAAYVLGIVLPILMVALVVLYSQTGVAALRSRINHYLATVVPDSAQILAAGDRKFVKITSVMNRAKRRATTAGPVVVLAQPERGLCTMNYALHVPVEGAPDNSQKGLYRRVLVRVELNVWKVNVNICVEEELAANLARELSESNSPPLLHAEAWKALFPHTLEGAKAEGYKLNPMAVHRSFMDRRYVALVLSRELRPNFMFDISQKLYFAQDLMFMTRAFLSERPDAFETTGKAG